MTTASPTPAANAPEVKENVLRGTLLSLIAIPAGALVFTIIYSFGYIAAIVAFGIAAAAYFLYLLGARRFSVTGAVVVAVVTLVAVLLSFVVAIVWDYAVYVSGQIDGTVWDALNHPQFWDAFFQDMNHPENRDVLLKDFGLSMLFAVLGAGGLIFSAFKEARGGERIETAAPIGGELSAEEQQAVQDAAAAQSGAAAAPQVEAPEPEAK